MKINIDPEKQITLYNRDFDIMRAELDRAIQRTIAKMIGKGASDGKITLTINISLANDVILNGDGTHRPAIHPNIGYKIGTVLQFKEDDSGDIVPYGSDELLTDGDGKFYVVSREEAAGQLSMFSTYEEYLARVRK